MKTINIISLVVVVLWILPKMCMEQIGPDKIGVRKSVDGGVAEEDFLPGWHLSLPLLHSWYELDATLHYLEFNDDAGNALDGAPRRTTSSSSTASSSIRSFQARPG